MKETKLDASKLDVYDLERAERELMLALSPGEESNRDLRLSDWAIWWGRRFLDEIRRLNGEH